MSGRILLAITMVLTSSAWAQSVISAHSGVIQYTEGQVKLDGKTVQPKFAVFAHAAQAKPQRRQRDLDRRHLIGNCSEMIVEAHARMRDEAQQKLREIIAQALRLLGQ